MNFWQQLWRLNLPNRLTLSRIVAAPVLVACLLSEYLWAQYVALLVFIGAALSDYWDGRLAREQGLVTNFGRIMDPLADKLLMATVFVSFVQLGFAPAWMVILIIGREFAITGLRLLAAVQGRVIAASTSGKHKTVSQIVAVIVILVVNAAVSSLRAWAPPWEYALVSIGPVGAVLLHVIDYAPYVVMFVAAVLSLYSGVEYLVKNRELFRDPQ